MVLAALAPMLVATAALSEALAAACALIGWPACLQTLAASPLATLIARERPIPSGFSNAAEREVPPGAKSVAPLLSAAVAAIAKPAAPTSDILTLLQLLAKFPDVDEAPPLEPLLQRLGRDEQTAFATESILNFADMPELAVMLLPRFAAVAPHAASAMVAELFRSPKLLDTLHTTKGLSALYELLEKEDAKVSPASPLPSLIGKQLLQRLLVKFDRSAVMMLPKASPTARGILNTLEERLTKRLRAIKHPLPLPREINLEPCCELCDEAVAFMRDPGDEHLFTRDDCDRGQPQHTAARIWRHADVTSTSTSLRIELQTDRQKVEEDLRWV